MSNNNSDPNETPYELPRTATPRLRFAEFRDAGEWEEKSLGGIASFYKGKGISKADINLKGETLCIRYGELYTIYNEIINEVISKTGLPASELFLSQKNDVLIPSSGETKLDIARASCVLLDGVALGGDLNILRTNENGIFLSYLLNGSLKIEIAKKAQGDTVVHLYANQLKLLKVLIPKPLEQQRIADCLDSLDELIATQSQKLDALRVYKSGLLQHLFPAEGETVPRLRFPEFQEAGKWEIKEVGEVFKVTRGEVLSMNLVQDTKTEKIPYPVYSSQTKNNGLAGFYSKYLYEDAITWTTDGANAGDVNYRLGKFFCTNVCGVLISEDGFANACMAALINNVSRNHVSYVGNPKLMNGVMSKIEIPFPSLPEQQRIADFLTSLDNLIAAQVQKVDLLKAHKKGLMQQIFP
ncbi:restriction endonuclease subunit S [Candidatus Oscillochloris fontis]|uniref:restriction endonuclease subunit S n=1 Tax=Candidatus Oscillochloris fontis TaxID=2496868 RepID=UPI00101C5B07|nr:restriction endonuclease subunit S [Candidatus Oscillochloris fontis]